MKKTLKILSVICAIVLIFGTVSVGMAAYAVSDNVIGEYDYTITSTYEDINWDNVTAYKSETHVHTVRSDADTEIDDMIHYYYDFGFDAMCLTDHGTVNYGWDHDQTRVVLYDYQWFVHGAMDELSESDYKNIITGQRNRTINSGKGMMELPLGIEWNGASTKKYHVNGYYANAGHGDLSILDNQDDAILGAIKGNYNAGGFSHVNHVGEWSGGNDNASVYSASWVSNFADYYKDYCPNRGGRHSSAQTSWMSSHKGEAGCIGMELVNTADSRTHNDRRWVYDEILKILAPQGINVFGFCEDDAHELSDCDRNAQYFLINNDKDTVITSSLFDQSNNESGSTSDYKNNNSDPMDRVQNYYRDAMFYGEFYASSKNSKNSYELGNGFNAKGEYPVVTEVTVDNDKDQIKVSYRNATKIRMVADGEVIETYKSSAGDQTAVFDLNSYEEKINSYVRIYLTGDGGITYLQPFLVTKTDSQMPTVHFNTPTADTSVVVKDSTGAVVRDEWTYSNFYYTLPAGDYTYTASRRGFETKTDSFTVTASDVANCAHKEIDVELQELSDVSYAYFYAPETIYLSPNDSRTFDKYIDRENAVNGALHNNPSSTGNIFFKREGATNIELSYNVIEGDVLFDTNVFSIGATTASGDTLATSITAGALQRALTNNEYDLVKWTATYDYEDRTYESYTYTYIYKSPSGSTSYIDDGYVAVGGNASTGKHIIEWAHSAMNLAGTVFVSGLNKVEIVGSDSNRGYMYAPGTGNTFAKNSDPRINGKGYNYKTDERTGASAKVETVAMDNAYIYADRSRVNNWSEIPYFRIGLDLNEASQVTDENNASNAVIRLLFDTTYADARDGTYSPEHILYDMEFSDQSNYILKTDYNLDDSSVTTTSGTYSRSLDSIGSGRLYESDNNVAARTLVHALPSASASETTIPISAYLRGCKEGRTDHLALEVDVTLVNVDKSSLRQELNDTVKIAYQREWFETEAAWNNYQDTIARGAKVLGNPASDPEAIEQAVTDLQEIVDNFELKRGTMVVKHYWSFNGQTGLIYAGSTDEFHYGDDLSANAAIITGYSYANRYECYAAESANEQLQLEDSGTADFDLQFAEKFIYEWRFYYTPNELNVTYNSLGADTDIETYTPTAFYDQNYTITTDVPARTGYQFDGWYFDLDEKTYTSGQTFKWIYDSDGEFRAQWISLDYNVAYNLDGGVFYDDDGNAYSNVPADYLKAVYGTSYSIYDDVPVKTGYNFIGWKFNGGDIHTPGSRFLWTITNNSEFTAQWELADYTVTFDRMADNAVLKDGNTTLANDYSITVNYDSAYGTLPTAVREGYTSEWYSDANYPASAKVDANTKVKIDRDHSLFAKWTPVDYPITYNLDGGAFSSIQPSTYNIESNDITIAAPVKTGYSFIGWSGNTFSGVKSSYTIETGTTGEIILNAHWDLESYDILYTLNGGTNDTKNPSSYSTEDTVTLYAPSKTGYRFTGWTGSNGSTPATDVTIPVGSTGIKEYTANWSIINYTITYNYNGATTTPSNRESYNVDTAAFTLINPAKTGYTFDGWDSNIDALDGETVTVTPGTVTGNLTFSARWLEADAISVTYHLNGGTVDGVNPDSYKEGSSYTLIAPTKAGYTFKNWTKKIGSAEPVSQAKGTIEATDHEALVFTAYWTPVTYTITCNLAGGKILSNSNNPVTYTPESPTITLVNPVRAGYTFTGWTGTDLRSATRTVEIPAGSIGNREYTANWSAVNYNITYNFNGGTDAGFIKTYNTNTNATIGTPLKPGYTFTGWDVYFGSFAWTANTTVSSGKIVPQTGSYCSDFISLQSGKTYTIDPGAATDVTLNVFSSSMTYIGSYTGSYTPSSDCIACLTAGSSQSSNLTSVKVEISGPLSSYSITSGSAGNMFFTAGWSGDEYTISYNLNDGALPTGQSNPTRYTYDSGDIVLINPEKTGYTFTGWEFNGVVSPSVTIPTHSTGNRTYVAVWEIATYTISYDGLEGAVDPNNRTSYTVDDDAFTLVNPTKTGYEFNGWIGSELSSASKNVTIASGSTGNKFFTATWVPVTYTITYNNVDGATNMGSNKNSYTIDTATFSLVAPVKPGATFEGWQGTDIEGTSKNVTISKGSTGNRTFTAVWNITTYNITYNLDGGTETTNPVNYTVNSEDISLRQPVKTGYTFTGWTGTGLGEATTSVIIRTGSTGHRAYTAHWQADTYTISYNLAGGEVRDNANPTSYTIETATIELVNPTKAGYSFAGWTGTGLSGATATVTIPKGSQGNRMYTATWVESGYSITYAGVDYDDISFPGTNKTFYTVMTETFTLFNPSRTGYTFLGWTGEGISGSGISTEVTIPKGSSGDRTYTAHWELTEYTITYDLDGGTSGGMTNPETYTYTTPSFTLYTPVKTGFTFVGWESDYFDDTRATVTIVNETGNKNFKAIWEAGNYTITYLGLENATFTKVHETYTANDSFTIGSPTKTGATFTGWIGTGITGSAMSITILQGSTGNRTYTATWSSVPNNITYNLNGGAVLNGANPTSYETGSGMLTIISPTRAGYKFNGWENDNSAIVENNSLTKSVKINTATGGNVNLEAKWIPLTYKITYNLNGGNVATANETTYTIETNSFTLVNPTRTGYNFAGWTGTGLEEGKGYLNVGVQKGSTGNRTYTALWAEASYKINYNYNGGSLENGKTNPFDYTVSSSFTLNNPVKTGYTFTGWTGTEIDGSKMVVTVPAGSTGVRNYTANFSIITYTITYLGLENATFTKVHETYTANDSFTIGSPTKTGYEFVGWDSVDSVNPVKDVTINANTTGDKTYTAVWSAINYTITYNLDGGSMGDNENPENYTVASPKIILLNPTKSGYVFVGWTSTTDGVVTASDYEEESLTAVIETGSTGNKEFTAVWDFAPYKISYAGVDKDFINSAPDSYRSSASVTIPNPVMAGYYFNGWTGTDLSTVTRDLTIPKGSTGDKLFTADWSIIEYKLTVNLNGGETAVDIPTSYTVRSDKIVLPTPTKQGYNFAGWKDETAVGEKIEGTVIIAKGTTGDREYTAQWEKRTNNTHRIYFYGYNDYPIIFSDGKTYKEAEIGHTIVDPLEDPTEDINYTVGYQITGWDIDFNSNNNINNPKDIEVHAYKEYSPDTYTVIVESSSGTTTTTCSQYEKFTAETDSTNSSGAKFSYWVVFELDENGNTVGGQEIAGFYRNHVFFVHSNVKVKAVYGDNSQKRAVTRVSYIEGYDPNYDWFTIYTERNVSDKEYNIVQHGVLFTTDASVGSNEGAFVIGTSGVYNGVSRDKSPTGLWTLSIPNPNQYKGTIYVRSYVKYADLYGNITTTYSTLIKTYANNEDVTP